MEAGNSRAHLYNLHEVEIYCDESGCRGFGPKATPWFGMCAVMIPHESVYQMRATVKGMQAVIGTSKPLHWTEHFSPKKRQERRETIAQMLANIPGITLIYVIADKGTLRASNALKTDGALFYHYVMKLLLERVVNQLMSGQVVHAARSFSRFSKRCRSPNESCLPKQNHETRQASQPLEPTMPTSQMDLHERARRSPSC